MLDITGKNISDLNDSDLRSLVGLLCEAELNSYGISAAGVTWGGHQNAPDGGIDVRVDVTTAPHPDSYIPRANTAYQVKKPDMPRSAIINEMKPKDNLRQVIKDLVDSSGAYIIVSSQGSTADSSLKDRICAMNDALKDLPNASNIKIDFYDRERMAGWVRSYPAIVLWIREKLGKPIQGWRPFGNWVNSHNNNVNEYFSDDEVRLYNSSLSSSDGMAGFDGIQALRKSLYQPASSIRLTGLSGVGKTRLVQVLFDENVGENPLNKAQVFYTDISDSPIPAPRNFAEQLIALKKPIFLVVDNCPPDLHRSLTSVCAASGSLVSLITVEYDVREDQPEETEVFRLEPSSTALLEKIITARFSELNQVDIRTIAEFSGGNSRIAIALAKTVQQGENLSSLRDEQLFERLFYQRNESDSDLLRAAEVCSLVYSFECDTNEGKDIELKLLSSLLGMNVRCIYKHISELKRRDLIQQRGVWRAVLPHAIANKLVQRALGNIPVNEILNVFEKGGSERLLTSFSRRLGYLHEDINAIDITNKWLSDGGLLGDVGNINKLGMDLFKNISPINPEATLLSIEKAASIDRSGEFLSRKNKNFLQITKILRSLAYDASLFTRAVNLLCAFALSEDPEENVDSIRGSLKSLFYIYLSGTHASAEQRLSIISSLIISNNENAINLAYELLDAVLEAWHFSSSHGFEFGARPRNYGYSPKSSNEIKHWFKLFIDFIIQQVISESKNNINAKSLLANKFRGLWIKAGVFDELESSAKEIIKQGGWQEGWIAVKTTLRFDSKNMDPQLVSRLNDLAILLNPTTLIEKVRLYALTSHRSALDLTDTYEDETTADSYYRVMEITRTLGQEVANNEEVLAGLLNELLTSNGARLYSFGQGLADNCTKQEELWNIFREALISIEINSRNFEMLRGFLNSISDKNPDIANNLLDECITDAVFGNAYPMLQTSIVIDDKSVERIKISLEKEVSPIWQYNHLAYGQSHNAISDKDLCDIIRLISTKKDGESVAIEILHMRLHINFDEKLILSDPIKAIGQELLLAHKFSREHSRSEHLDYAIGEIIEACFVDDSSASSAEMLCEKLAKAFANYDIYRMDYGHVLEALATIQPISFLNGFLGEEMEVNHRISRVLSTDDGNCACPISKIDNNLIIKWCEENPIIRYPFISSAIRPYKIGDKDERPEWTSLAKTIIVKSSDPLVILNEFKSSFRPMSWSGSRADIMRKRLCLLVDLKNHTDSVVSQWAISEEIKFEKEILMEEQSELKYNRSNDERFE